MARLLWVVLSLSVVSGILGISVEVTVGGVFSFGAMTVGGGNVAVGLDFDSTVVTTFPCETLRTRFRSYF